MPLTSGTRVGPYEILSAIGAGGMGEVYKARDTRLDRIVAVKVLSASLDSDPQFRERFDREAKAISALDHPHICTLYDVGSQDGMAYFVMQYLDGEPLNVRLERGALPLAEALQYATQIADALSKAHKAGIIHRDLKPGNLMLTKTGAMLLDFGLAKATAPAVSAANVSMLPTTPANLTAQGTILGTFQYMAPEQIEGDEADARTDIFAFGVLLYEMLTGRPPFQGRSQASLMSAILKDEPPPVSQTQPLIPPALDHVVVTCLSKRPDDRFQTAHDLLLQLRWIAQGGSALGVPVPVAAHRKTRERTRTIALAVVSLLWLATVGAAVWYWLRLPEPAEVHFAVPTGETLNGLQVTVSPDGQLIAYIAKAGVGAREAVLWIRPMNSTVAQPLPGTESAFHPFWSPDSRWIGFGADTKLKRIDVAGGPPQVLCDIPLNYGGGTWNRDGVILFGSGSGIRKVSATGGESSAVTHPDATVRGHLWPFFLPDGRHFLYLDFSADPRQRGVVVASLDSTERTKVLSAESMAMYAPPGYLLFHRAGTLLAAPFDAAKGRVRGDPMRIAERVANNPANGRAAFAVSDTGTLVYRMGATSGASVLEWVDRSGKSLGTVGEPGEYRQLKLSPDSKRVALERRDTKTNGWNIWMLDLASNITAPVTFDSSIEPVWSGDSRAIAFASDRTGHIDFYQKIVGGGAETPIFQSPETPKYIDDWSSDGRYLLYHGGDQTTLYGVAMTGDRKPVVLDKSRFAKDEAHFSPDGRWVAFESNESGSVEAYVASFPAFDNRRQISLRGGAEPRWRADGREIVYLGSDGKLMSVEVTPAATAPEFAPPQVLLQSPFTTLQNGVDHYAMTRDGKRFLFLKSQTDGAIAPLNVVLNWPARLKK